jgi:hypothetical protein
MHALQAIFFDVLAKISQKVVGDAFPELVDLGFAIFLFEKAEQFAVTPDKFGTGNHTSSFQKR